MPLKVVKKISSNAPSGGGGGGAGVIINRLEIRSTDPPGKIYALPPKVLITHVIVRSLTNKSLSIQLFDGITGVIDPLVDLDVYIANELRTFAPTVGCDPQKNVEVRDAIDTQTNVDIFYTTTTV